MDSDKIKEKNLSVQEYLGTEVGEILVDPTRFEQLVRNLVNDAIEAAPYDGTVSIDTAISIPSSKALETAKLSSETYFELKVQNHGKLIPQDEIQKIFSPFYTTADYGAGIGLVICKKIVEDHGGSISVRSDSEGTAFTVWLPVKHGQAETKF